MFGGENATNKVRMVHLEVKMQQVRYDRNI